MLRRQNDLDGYLQWFSPEWVQRIATFELGMLRVATLNLVTIIPVCPKCGQDVTFKTIANHTRYFHATTA